MRAYQGPSNSFEQSDFACVLSPATGGGFWKSVRRIRRKTREVSMHGVIIKTQALLLFLLFAGAAFGQKSTGEIKGTVLDPSGAVVQKAAVTAKDTATGLTYSADLEHGRKLPDPESASWQLWRFGDRTRFSDIRLRRGRGSHRPDHGSAGEIDHWRNHPNGRGNGYGGNAGGVVQPGRSHDP